MSSRRKRRSKGEDSEEIPSSPEAPAEDMGETLPAPELPPESEEIPPVSLPPEPEHEPAPEPSPVEAPKPAAKAPTEVRAKLGPRVSLIVRAGQLGPGSVVTGAMLNPADPEAGEEAIRRLVAKGKAELV